MLVRIICILLPLYTLSALGGEEWTDVDPFKLSRKMREILCYKAVENNKDAEYIMSCKEGDKIASIFCRFKEIMHKKYSDVEFPLFLSPEVANMPVDKKFIKVGCPTGFLPLEKLIYILSYPHPIKLSCSGDIFLISVNEKKKKEMEKDSNLEKETQLNNEKQSAAESDWQVENVGKIPEKILTIETDYIDSTHCLITIDDKKFNTPDSVDLYLRQMDKERYKNGIHLQGNDKRVNEMEYAVIGIIKKFIKEHNVDFYFSVPRGVHIDKPFTKISKRNNENKTIDSNAKK